VLAVIDWYDVLAARCSIIPSGSTRVLR